MPYIYNADSTATANADFNVQSYTEIGVPPGADITVVQPVARVSTSVSSAQTTNVAVRIASNPVVAEFSYAIVSQEADLEPGGSQTSGAGWKSVRGITGYNPTPVRSTRPIVRVGKRTATTRVAMVDFVGMYVEYNDEVSPTLFVAVNQVTEIQEAGEEFLSLKNRAINQITQTQTAQIVTPGIIATHNVIINTVEETETAQPLISTGSTPINQVMETDEVSSLQIDALSVFIGSA